MGSSRWGVITRRPCARAGCENSGLMNSSQHAPPAGWDDGFYCSDECMEVGHKAGWEAYYNARDAHERVSRALAQWWRPLRRHDVRLALQFRSGPGLW